MDYSNTWGKAVVDKALEYVNFEWKATEKNVLHGVDCSGLLTICWELPKRIATRDIPAYATVVEKIDEIQQGDIFAKLGSHVMFFKEFTDNTKAEVLIIDSTRSTGKVSQRKMNVAELFSEGYEIYRKR